LFLQHLVADLVPGRSYVLATPRFGWNAFSGHRYHIAICMHYTIGIQPTPSSIFYFFRLSGRLNPEQLYTPKLTKLVLIVIDALRSNERAVSNLVFSFVFRECHLPISFVFECGTIILNKKF
jgi:hypothetical protein